MLSQEKIYQAIKTTKKGTFVKITYQTEMKATNKTDKIIKTTNAVVRLGINYSNLKAVKTERANGKQTDGKLSWGQWENGFENYVITHTKDNVFRKYLRVYTTKHKSKSTYQINGKETTLLELRENELIKESKSSSPRLLVIKFTDIISIG